jgi:hypothetical protein
MTIDIMAALAIALVIGFALGYAVRAAISSRRRHAARKRRHSFWNLTWDALGSWVVAAFSAPNWDAAASLPKHVAKLRRQTMSGIDLDSLTPTENRLTQIEKRLVRIEGKLNFGLSIIIALSVLTLIKLFWPDWNDRYATKGTATTAAAAMSPLILKRASTSRSPYERTWTPTSMWRVLAGRGCEWRLPSCTSLRWNRPNWRSLRKSLGFSTL